LVKAGDIEPVATVGTEELALQAFREFGFPGILEAGGLGGKTKTALAQVAARTVRPAS
jgi:hypothetical protein